MRGRELEAEMWAAVEAVRLPHIRRMEALGVPLRAIAEVGEHLPPFGVARVRWLPDGLYEPDPDGETACIMPVPAAERELGELGLLDLVAFSTSQPSRWSWRTGLGWLLGEHVLDDDDVAVVETPVQWLARKADAVCILNWDAPASCWSALRQIPCLHFENETLGARVMRRLREAVVLPRMEIINAA